MKPISFYLTRSFWFGIVPALLVALDTVVHILADPEMGGPVAWAISQILGLIWDDIDAASIEAALLRLAPVFALIVAQQRGGSARPYTARWTGG